MSSHIVKRAFIFKGKTIPAGTEMNKNHPAYKVGVGVGYVVPKTSEVEDDIVDEQIETVEKTHYTDPSKDTYKEGEILESEETEQKLEDAEKLVDGSQDENDDNDNPDIIVPEEDNLFGQELEGDDIVSGNVNSEDDLDNEPDNEDLEDSSEDEEDGDIIEEDAVESETKSSAPKKRVRSTIKVK